MEIEKGSKTEPDSTMIGFDKHFKNLQINGKDKENGTPQELSQNHNEKLLEENLLEFTKKWNWQTKSRDQWNPSFHDWPSSIFEKSRLA